MPASLDYNIVISIVMKTRRSNSTPFTLYNLKKIIPRPPTDIKSHVADFFNILLLILPTVWTDVTRKEGPFLFYVYRSEVACRGRGGGGGDESEGSTVDTSRKRPERPWTAARSDNGSVNAVSTRHRPATCALRNCCFNCCAWAVTKTMSVALLLTNNSEKRKKSNFRSPVPSPYSWSLLG